MSQTTLDEVQTDMAYLLGEQSVPATSNADYAVRSTFIQRSLERIYRIFDFNMNRLTATVSLTSGSGLLPADARDEAELDVRIVMPGTNDDYVFEAVRYEDNDKYASGEYRYWLTEDSTTGRWRLNTTETAVSAVTVRYLTQAPVINNSIATPFPSSMVVALGAMVYYRVAEDPQADIGADEDEFRMQLNEVIAAERRNQPRRRGITRAERLNHYSGELSGYFE
jgi:hypothetical protein